MADSTIHIEIRGMKELQAKLAKFPREIKKTIADAGREAVVDVILREQGVQKYPPATAANAPPAPYYIRGRGMMYKSGLKVTSERLGSQAGGQITGSWGLEQGDLKTTLVNRASYARYVIGEEQARAMGAKGWRKMIEVAREKQAQITTIYNRHVNRLLHMLNL